MLGKRGVRDIPLSGNRVCAVEKKKRVSFDTQCKILYQLISVYIDLRRQNAILFKNSIFLKKKKKCENHQKS